MKYFVTDEERQGTCYHEFFKGKWDGLSFWKKDSICLHDDILSEIPDFEKAILAVIPSYDPFGETEVSLQQWLHIGKLIAISDKKNCKELYQEANVWAQDVFQAFDRFTILGI